VKTAFTIFLFIFFHPCYVQSQSYLLKSKIKDSGRASKTHTLLQYDSSGYYILRYSKNINYAELEHYNQQLKHQKTYLVTDKARKYIGVVRLDQKMYMLYFYYVLNKQQNTHDKVSLYAEEILPETYALSGDSIELIEPFKMVSNYYTGNFAISPDQSKFLVYDYEEDGDIEGLRGLTNKIRLRVFDRSFNQLWTRTVNLSPNGGAKRQVAIKKLRINNRGEVAILTDIFRKTRSYNLKNITADPTLFFVGKEKNNYALFQPQMGDYFFNQISFTFDSNGDIIWFGFYSKERYYQQKGVFFIKINSDRTKVLVKKMHELSPELLAQLLHRNKVRPDTEARSYKLKHWNLMADGGIVLSAEQQPSSSFNFKCNDILSLRFDASGDIMWAKHFFKHGNQPKNQKVFLSHFLCNKNNHTYLIYNRGIYSDGYANVTRIDSAGRVTNKKIYNYLNQQELVCPPLSYHLPGTQLFLCLQDRYFSNYRFALLDLEKLFSK
jgi:hypothetical protein